MRPGPHVAPQQAAILDGLSAHIDKVLDRFYDFGVRTGWQETPESPLAHELRRVERQYGPGTGALPLRTLDWDRTHLGRLAVESLLFTSLVGQHLECLRVLLNSREVIFALAPPARAILEITGHVFWLLDPNVGGVRDRVARAVTSKLLDATREKTAALAVAHPDAPRIGASVRDLRRVTIPATFYPSEIQHTRDGKIVLRGQAYPGLEGSLRYISEATGVPWNTSGMYAYLSNASHPSLHIITESLDVQNGQITGFGQDGVTLQYRITRMAIMCFVRSWQLNAAYYGLDQAEAGDLGEEIETLPAP